MSTILSFHPTYAFFRNPFEYGTFRCDLDRFARLIKGKLRPGPTSLLTKPTVKDLDALFNSSSRVTCDIETAPRTYHKPWTGLNPLEAKLKVLGFGTTTHGLAIYMHTASRKLLDRVRYWLRQKDKTIVFHNGFWFDRRVLSRYGFKVRNHEDTRDARMALTPTSQLNLNYLASIYDDCEPWKENEADDEKGMVFTRNRKALLKYCAQDCVETSRVDEGIRSEEEWNTPRVQRLYKHSKQLSVFCAEMHTNGIKVHVENRKKLRKELIKEFREAAAATKKLVGITAFKCNSNDMRKLIFKRHQTKEIKRFSLPDPINPKLFTKTGACAVDKDGLVALVANPFVDEDLKTIIRTYWKAMEAQKALGTFVVSKHIDHAIGADGRLRPGWNSCGTDTGRFACSRPNMQNVSRDLRQMYTCEDGNVIIHVDFSQLELRVMAAVSGDQVLKEALEAGDVYAADAQALFPQLAGLSLKEIKALDEAGPKRPRQLAKMVHLAFQYAAGTPTVFAQVLAQDITAKWQAVKEVHKGLLKRYVGTTDYWAREKEAVGLVGYSESRVLKRRRVYPAEPSINDVANYPIQSTAADIMNLASLRLRKMLRKHSPSTMIISQQHDALDLETSVQNCKEVVDLVKEVFEQPVQIEGQLYKFPVGIKTGHLLSEVA